MSTKAQRGTKRTCQNPECGSRFYDLNHEPIVCPVCESAYQLALSATSNAPAAEEKRKPAKKPAFVPPVVAKSEEPAEGEAEELVAIEGEEETAAAEDDETFLEEEEEDGADVSGIIGGPVDDKDEPS